MKLNELINSGMLLKIQASNFAEFIDQANTILLKAGYVNPEFKNAIIQREATFPTGVVAKGVNIAVPHVDAKYVCQNALILCQLNPPVKFKRMDMNTEVIDVDLAFILLIKDVKLQVHAISSLTDIWRNESILLQLKKVNDKTELLEVIKSMGHKDER